MKNSLYWVLSIVLIVLLGVGAMVILSDNQKPVVVADMHRLTTTGMAEKIGTVEFVDTKEGLYASVRVRGLTPGQHGFHIHEGDSCGPRGSDGRMDRGLVAGGHYDPHGSGNHAGPDGMGHTGDLPVLVADDRGNVKTRFLVKTVTADEIVGRTLVIHDGGDNYSDMPQPLGGGGGRYACGVIKM